MKWKVVALIICIKVSDDNQSVMIEYKEQTFNFTQVIPKPRGDVYLLIPKWIFKWGHRTSILSNLHYYKLFNFQKHWKVHWSSQGFILYYSFIDTCFLRLNRSGKWASALHGHWIWKAIKEKQLDFWNQAYGC